MHLDSNNWYIKYSNGIVDMGGKGSFTGIDELTLDDTKEDLSVYITTPVHLISSSGACVYVNGIDINGHGVTSPYPPDYTAKIGSINNDTHTTQIVVRMDYVGYDPLHLINVAANNQDANRTNVSDTDISNARQCYIDRIADKGVTKVDFFWRCIGRYASA